MLTNQAKCNFPTEVDIWKRMNCKADNFCFREHSRMLCEAPFCNYEWHNYGDINKQDEVAKSNDGKVEQNEVSYNRTDMLQQFQSRFYGAEDDDSGSVTDEFENFNFGSSNFNGGHVSEINGASNEPDSEADFLKLLQEAPRGRSKRELTRWTGKSIWTPERCRRRCDDKIKPEAVTQLCQQQKAIAFKTIRLCQVADYQPMMRNFDTYVLVLHRDPRALFNSRMNILANSRKHIMMERAITKHCKISLHNYKITHLNSENTQECLRVDYIGMLIHGSSFSNIGVQVDPS